MKFTAMDIFLIALKNYRENKIITFEEGIKIDLWYIKNIHQTGATIETVYPFWKREFRSWVKGSDLNDEEIKNTERKVLEYLKQAKNRMDKSRRL